MWQNTTQAHAVWDAPIYREFFEAVRAVNRGLPPERRLRVLLGDPPIDWSDITTPEQLQARLMARDASRDCHAAALIRREVLAKGRRALLIYGELHLTRKNPFGTAVPEWVSIVERLERDDRAAIFSIWTYTMGGDLATLAPEVTSWTPPVLTVLAGTVLGRAEFGFYYPFEVRSPGGVIKAAPGPMAEQFDALLYLGPTGGITYSRLGATECADSGYLAMPSRRMALAQGDTASGPVRAGLERACAARPR